MAFEGTASDIINETVDAFHRGGFFLVQPKGRGHRAGMDAMLLAALVGEGGAVAD
ncbi:methyltransferase, partial [Agrobacterium vitis]|nr:methyltransferase [Agrobacterium vitis]